MSNSVKNKSATRSTRKVRETILPILTDPTLRVYREFVFDMQIMMEMLLIKFLTLYAGIPGTEEPTVRIRSEDIHYSYLKNHPDLMQLVTVCSSCGLIRERDIQYFRNIVRYRNMFAHPLGREDELNQLLDEGEGEVMKRTVENGMQIVQAIPEKLISVMKVQMRELEGIE